MVRVGEMNAEDLGSNSRLGLLNEFVLGDPKGKFTIPGGILNWGMRF